MAKKINTQKHIEELISDAEFMRRKLAESKKAMEEEPIAIPYDNGGGQTGVRENPIFTAYEKLLKTYQGTVNQIIELSGKDEKTAELEKDGKVLKMVGNSKWKRQA